MAVHGARSGATPGACPDPRPNGGPRSARVAAKPSASLAKLTPPRLNDVYARTRLFEALDAARKRPVVWISSPAGSGKTMLVASYLKARDLPCLWYQIDAGDEDPASFFYFMGLAVQLLAPGRKPLPLLAPEYLAGLPTFARNYFREVYHRLARPTVVVLDNYQEIAGNAPVRDMLLQGLLEVPEGITVIINSRDEVPPEYSGLRAAERLSQIGWADMRLTRAEGLEIARLRTRDPELAESVFEAIDEYVQGWLAGLILVLEQSNKTPTRPVLEDQKTQAAIFDYFAGEILTRTSPRIRRFLLTTSFLPTLTACAAHALTGVDGAAVLSDLAHRNYFTLRHADAGATYEYHPLFRAFLQNRARSELPPETLRHTQLRAAELLAADGRVEDAVALLTGLQEWERAVTLVLEHAPVLLQQGRSVTLMHWIETVPADLRSAMPCLQYWLALCRLPSSPTAARRLLEAAYTAFRARGERDWQLRTWCALVDTFVFEWGDFSPLDPWIAEIGPVLADDPKLPTTELDVRLVGAVFMALMYRQPQHPALPHWQDRAWSIVMQGGELAARMHIGTHLAIYYLWFIGDLAKAGMIVTTLRPLLDSHSVDPLLSGAFKFIECGYRWMIAENGASLTTADQGLRIADESGVHVWDMFLATQAATAALSSNRPELAKPYIDMMPGLLAPTRYMDVMVYYHVLGWNALLHGDARSACEHARLSLDAARRSGTPFLQAVGLVAMASAAYRNGDPVDPYGLLSEARAIGRTMRSHSIECLSLLVEAEIAQAENDEPRCLEAMRRGLAVARRQGFQNHDWWRGDVMARFYAKALEHSIETDYVRHLIRRHQVIPADPPWHLDLWPWPVRVYTFGRFSVLKDDEPLKFNSRAQGRPLELLKCLIAFGGRAVTEEQLCEALWPEADGDAAHRSLGTTLHRLRRLLRHDQAIEVENRRVTLDGRYVWVDVWAFERGLTQGEQHDDIERLERALRLYQTGFLSRDPAPWASPLRERLRSRYLRTVEVLGARLERESRWQEAAHWYQQGIEADHLAEALYRKLMVCYQHLDRHAEAVAVFRRCCDALNHTLGVEPGVETRRLLP